jgi:hypothetical protein
MLSVTLSLLLNPVPYLVTNNGNLLVTTPTGVVITIPEGSEFNTNQLTFRLDAKVITLDNVSIFKDGFENE